MRHNKMYREIKGYENAKYMTSEIRDDLEEMDYKISYGEEIHVLIDIANEIELKIKIMKSNIRGYE